MALDEEIKRALEQNSTWDGSADQLWENIAAKLQPGKSWWQRGPFWLGTAAATLLLTFVLRTSLLAPAVPEPEFAPRMQTFTALMADEPRRVRSEERLEIPLELHPLPLEFSKGQQPRLLIWQVNGEEMEELRGELPLATEELVGPTLLMVDAPADPGTYRLVVQGVLQKEDGPYEVSGELKITVEK